MKADGSSSVLYHPAAADVAKFCREEIEKCGSTFSRVTSLHLCLLIFRAGSS